MCYTLLLRRSCQNAIKVVGLYILHALSSLNAQFYYRMLADAFHKDRDLGTRSILQLFTKLRASLKFLKRCAH